MAALLGGRQGSIAQPLNSSMGWHGLVRTLPLIVGHWRDLRFDATLTRDVTALAYGNPLARDAVAQLTDSPGGSEYVPARDPNRPTQYHGD